MSRPYADLMGSIRYGYAPYYAVQVEGIPTLLVEVEADAIAPAGYTLAPSLVIDSGARVGSVIDPKNHIGKGFDFEFRTLPGVFDTYLERPGVSATLSADIDHTTGTIPTSTPWVFAGQSPLFMGLETLGNNNLPTDTGLTGATRGLVSRARQAKRGMLIANRPTIWQGRKVTVYLLVIDPSGRYVQGADVLSQGCVIWEGFINSRPIRSENTWYFTASEQTARFNDPFSVAGGGKLEIRLDDDALTTVDPEQVIRLRAVHRQPDFGGRATPIVIFDHTITPFRASPATMRWSEVRQAVSDAWATETASSTVVTQLGWVQYTDPRSGVVAREWRATLGVDYVYTDGMLLFYCESSGSTPFTNNIIRSYTWSQASAENSYEMPLTIGTLVAGSQVTVELEDGNDILPSPAGWIRVEGDGIDPQVIRYTNAIVDPTDSGKIHLTLSEAGGLSISDIAQRENFGEELDLSATFLWRASGPVQDILRSIIVSSGDSTGGTWDTLPRGQGYAIQGLNADSFDSVFDGSFDALSFEFSQDAGDSLSKLFGGLLRLSGRGLTARRSTTGGEVEVAAVNIGSADTARPQATITDADLADTGRMPVRALDTYAAPMSIKTSAKLGGSDRSPTITYRSPHLADYSNDTWDLDIYGLTRTALFEPAKTWANAWFRTGENRQIIEIDVGPWHDVQVGDVVSLSLRDANIWDYATGRKGIVSFARVLGSQLSLDKGFQILTVSVDGIFANRPLCPSMRVLAFNGSATNPNWIEVSGAYFPLCREVWAGGSAGCVVYRPGEDFGFSEYVFSGVSLVGSNTRLTRLTSPGSPTVTLTTSHYLTWRREDLANTIQKAHTHIGDGTQWS